MNEDKWNKYIQLTISWWSKSKCVKKQKQIKHKTDEEALIQIFIFLSKK